MGNDYRDPYTAERDGPNELTKQYPELSGFLQSLMGTSPDEMGSVLDPLTAPRREGAKYGFPIGVLAQLAPVLRGLGLTSRTGRNVERAIRGTKPHEAAVQELARNPSGLERSVAVSKRGVAGPVRVGTVGAVQPGRSSRLAPAVEDFHTHSATPDFFGMHPGDVKESLRGKTTILHTSPDGEMLGRSESLVDPQEHLSRMSDWSYSDPQNYRKWLELRGKYTSDVPEDLYNREAWGDLMDSKGFLATPEQRMLQGVYRGYAGDEALPEKIFAANQRQLAEFYAARRAAQTGQEPHVDMLLIDPNIGQKYRLHPPGAKDMSGVRKLRSEDVEERTNLYAQGGHVDLTKAENQRDPYASQRGGISELAKKYPELHGFLGSLLGTAPDEFESGSVLDPEAMDRKKAVALGAKYGFPLGTLLQALPFGGGVAASKAPAAGGRLAQRGVIKAPGGNWLSGSVENSLSRLKKAENLDNPDQAYGLNNWIDKQLTRYVKNEMATEGDPLRALAERGILHVNPEQLNFRPEVHGKYLEPGQTAIAKSLPAKAWEGASDLTVSTNPAGRFLKPELGFAIEKDSWLKKVPPETLVHELGSGRGTPADLGFDHLMDELRNATNPDSGLPRELLLKYSSLPQLSVPQAVERVARINEWREAQKIAANQALANNAATVLHKDYPGKGFRWVELRAGKELPAGYQIKDLNNVPTLYGPDGKSIAQNWDYDTLVSQANRPSLKDALKYEGDTMGHCVGGYCDDVASGLTQIYSLRDAKGQPHVTIEVGSQANYGSDYLNAQRPQAEAEALERGLDPDKTNFHSFVVNRMSELAKVNFPASIKQIKGKANRAPNEEYLPFVQDFVKSGKWSGVDDLHNTGLRRAEDAFNDLERKTLFGQDTPGYLTDAEIAAHQQRFSDMAAARAAERKRIMSTPMTGDDIAGEWTPEFDQGGLVSFNPDSINKRAADLAVELGF